MLVDARPPAATRSVYVRPSALSASVWARPSRDASVSATRTKGGIVTVDGSTRPGRMKMNVAGTRFGSDGVAPVAVDAPCGGAVPWTSPGFAGAVCGAAVAVAGGGVVALVETGFTVPESPPQPPRATIARTAGAAMFVR
jgi:hypothetical protein